MTGANGLSDLFVATGSRATTVCPCWQTRKNFGLSAKLAKRHQKSAQIFKKFTIIATL